MKKTRLFLILTVALMSTMIFLLTSCGPALESITATYNAVPNAGNMISEDHSEIRVTAHYADGSEEVIEKGWKVENPGSLVGGQENTYTISYQDKTCELNIEVMATNRQDYSNLGTTADDISKGLNDIAQ